MSKNFILFDESPIVASTALDVSRSISEHAYHDRKRMGSTFSESIPLAVAFSIISAGLVINNGSVQEVLQNSVTVGFLGASAYVSRTIYEARSKLAYMRRHFDDASQAFREQDKKLTANLKSALDVYRPAISEMFDIQKYPIRTSLALALSGAAAISPEGQASLIAMWLNFFLMGILAHEENHTKHISDHAIKAHDYLKTANKMRLSGDLTLDS